MVKKALFENLMSSLDEEDDAPAPKSVPAASSKSPIQAIRRSLQDHGKNTIHDIPADLIDQSDVSDRLLLDGIDDLAKSIQEEGQLVPAMVRPHPEQPGRYIIIYGRRRLAAVKKLGLPLRVIISDIDAKKSLFHQVMENAWREDLTWIESALLAKMLEEHQGFPREEICRALNANPSLLSRYSSVLNRVDKRIIKHIGPSRGHGRKPWGDLAEIVQVFDENDIINFLESDISSENGDHIYKAISVAQHILDQKTPHSTEAEDVGESDTQLDDISEANLQPNIAEIDKAETSEVGSKTKKPEVPAEKVKFFLGKERILTEIDQKPQTLSVRLKTKANPEFADWFRQNSQKILQDALEMWKASQIK